MTQSAQLKQPFIDFILPLFKRQVSNFYIVFGRRGSGKTDFCLKICELLHEQKVISHFATNIKIYHAPFPVEKVTNLEDLRYWCQNTKGKKLMVLDEIGKTVGRRTPMRRLNVDMLNELQIIRKHKLSLLCSTIAQENTDKGLLLPSVLDGIFLKTSFRNPKKAYFIDQLSPRTQNLIGLPRTSVHFDTWDSAPFTRYGEKRRPKFKTEELELLWDYSQGSSYKELGLHPQSLARLLRKFLKEYMERTYSQFTHK